MADSNVDPYYTITNIPYTDEFMNITNNVNTYQSGQREAIDIGSSEALESWDFQYDADWQYPPLSPFGINGETSNQIETNLGNEFQEPVSLPLPLPLPLPSNSTADIGSFLGDLLIENSNCGMNNQTETNLGNEIQQPFSFPCLVPPFTEQTGAPIVEYNGESSTQRETNLEPSPQVQFGCHCCEVLREIVHIGTLVMKLQIHGRLVGVIFHAVLDVQQSSEAVSREMFNFYEKSFEEVKQFLIQYCLKRKQEGYIMMSDPKSSFFEALCIGFDWYQNLINGADPVGIDQMYEAANGGDLRGKGPLLESNEAVNYNNRDKTLTVQRKRVKEMTAKDLKDYLHLSRKEAAEKLGFCETVINKIWSKGNGGAKRRWPYRKIQSLQKKIMELKEQSKSSDPHVRVRAINELRTKNEELKHIEEAAA